MPATIMKNLLGSELRAVGITEDGGLHPVRSANSLRGVPLTSLIVSIKHRAWFKENEKVLRAAFPDKGSDARIIIFGSADSIAEVF